MKHGYVDYKLQKYNYDDYINYKLQKYNYDYTLHKYDYINYELRKLNYKLHKSD